jgi:hypothetical protein
MARTISEDAHEMQAGIHHGDLLIYYLFGAQGGAVC